MSAALGSSELMLSESSYRASRVLYEGCVGQWALELYMNVEAAELHECSVCCVRVVEELQKRSFFACMRLCANVPKCVQSHPRSF